MVKGVKKATIRQKSPMAPGRAKPRMVQKSCCFREGSLAEPMMRLPNTVPILAPEPATPTVAAPAPANEAAVSMSLEMALVWKLQLDISEVRDVGLPSC